MRLTVLCDRVPMPPLVEVAAVHLVTGLPYAMLAGTPTLALCEVECDDAAKVKADGRCVVLAAEDPKHETGRLALRSWLTAKGLSAEEVTQAAGTLGAPKTGRDLVDSLKTVLAGQTRTNNPPKDS